MSSDDPAGNTDGMAPDNGVDMAVDQQELADAMPHIVWSHDQRGRPIYFNRKWTEYTGLDLATTLKAGASSTVHPDDQSAVAKRFGAAASDGTPFEMAYRLRRHDGCYRWHHARVVPLRLRDSGVHAWVGTALDIDDDRRLQDEQQFLIEATSLLGTSLETEKTLSNVAHLVVPRLADWCAIDLLDEAGVLRRPAVAHVDPTKVQLACDLHRRYPPQPADPHGVYAVVRERRGEHHEDIPDALLQQLVSDPELLGILRALGLRSSICVPLVAQDRVLGALTLVSAESGRLYRKRDLAFAEEFARRISLAVDNARLYTEATDARRAAEAMAADVVEQSSKVQQALLAMRADRDSAIADRDAALARLDAWRADRSSDVA